MKIPKKDKPLAPSAAARELLARQDSAEHLLPFVRYSFDGYQTGEHHRLICEALERVESGDCRRLMIFMPPRHGKSLLASTLFPAWYLGRNPARQIITASYSSDLATDFSRQVRNTIDSREFANVFDAVKLAQDSKAANRWHTAEGGSYVAAGVGSSITGRGADLALIDDPHKDRQEAESETIRERVKSWYTSTLRTRLMPGAAIILIQTRWHEDDLAGWLLEQAKHDGEQWEVLSLPALSDGEDDALGRPKGEPLWPDWFNLAELESTRKAVGPRDWSALYQQRPVPSGGGFFSRDWLRLYDELPPGVRHYGASDYAVSETGDFTVHGVCAIDQRGDLYIVDWWRDQVTPDVAIDAWLDLVAEYRPLGWGDEKGVLQKALAGSKSKRMQERGVFCRQIEVARTTDKASMATGFQGRMSAGRVFFPRNAPWLPGLLSEMMSFPAGKHDDQVDVLAMFGVLLEGMVQPRRQAPGPITAIQEGIR